MNLLVIKKESQFPDYITIDLLSDFLHRVMKPWEDKTSDIKKGIQYALDDSDKRGGFIILALENKKLLGGSVVLKTNMSGYIPPNLLLFIGVDPELRGKGIGGKILDAVKSNCIGDIKLHVEPENKAGNLYERKGFKIKYNEMRFSEE
ncbi:MAG: GNAT family N-acetyltransferase [Deltaproteobacteria bacterium]|nr:GNAT family N-acetyltransferase [Deltaproteobacteria bacterium]